MEVELTERRRAAAHTGRLALRRSQLFGAEAILGLDAVAGHLDRERLRTLLPGAAHAFAFLLALRRQRQRETGDHHETAELHDVRKGTI